MKSHNKEVAIIIERICALVWARFFPLAGDKRYMEDGFHHLSQSVAIRSFLVLA
jgi:hypothetical protein